MMIEDQIRGLIGNERFENLQNKALRKMCNLIDCFKCKVQFQFQEGNPRDAPKKDATGKEIKPEYAKEYATNRFICPNSSCKT